MKIKDVLKISTKNIKIYLKRNLMIMAVMGVIFGLIFAINLWLTGMEKTYVAQASRATGGQVIIAATNSTEGMIIDDTRSKTSRADMKADIEAHGGKVLGDTEKFGMFGAVVLPAELVKNAIEVDLDKTPADAAPVLITTFLGEQLLNKDFPNEYTSAINKQKDYENYREELIGKTFTDSYGAKYYVVGLASSNFHINNLSFKQLERGNSNPLNPILEMIPTLEGAPIVIDNGKSQLWQKGSNVLENNTSTFGEVVVNDITAYSPTNVEKSRSEVDETIIAVFDGSEKAYEYLKNGNGRFMNIDLPNRTYSVTVIAGMSPESAYILKIIKMVANIASVVLGIIAAIVVIFTSIRLIDQDRHNIALHYSLGATTGQVRIIYLCYFLELMIGAAIFAFVFANIIVLSFSALNKKMLGIQAMLGFNQMIYESVWWYGMNLMTLMIFVAMLIMAPLCILANRKAISRISSI